MNRSELLKKSLFFLLLLVQSQITFAAAGGPPPPPPGKAPSAEDMKAFQQKKRDEEKKARGEEAKTSGSSVESGAVPRSKPLQGGGMLGELAARIAARNQGGEGSARPVQVIAGQSQGALKYPQIEHSYKNHDLATFQKNFNQGDVDAQARLFILTKRGLVTDLKKDGRKEWIEGVVKVDSVFNEIQSIVDTNKFSNPNYKFKTNVLGTQFMATVASLKSQKGPSVLGESAVPKKQWAPRSLGTPAPSPSPAPTPISAPFVASVDVSSNQQKYEKSLTEGFNALKQWQIKQNIGSSNNLISEMNKIGAHYFSTAPDSESAFGGFSASFASSSQPQGTVITALNDAFDINYARLDAFMGRE